MTHAKYESSKLTNLFEFELGWLTFLRQRRRTRPLLRGAMLFHCHCPRYRFGISLLLSIVLFASPVVHSWTCTLTIQGPASSISACKATALLLGSSRDLLAYNVTFQSRFSCSSCTRLGGGSLNGTCNAVLVARLTTPSILQYYANAWAVPVGGSYGVGAYMTRIHASNPTCSGQGNCSDLFPLRASTYLGGGEQIRKSLKLHI